MNSNPMEEADPIAQAAAEWALRHDRGLTAVEQDDFSRWLAADQRHRAAWAEARWSWDELDRLAGLQTSVHAVPAPDLLAPKRSPLLRWIPLALAAAAMLAAGAIYFQTRGRLLEPVAVSTVTTPRLALIEQRELSDGSVVELNRGAVVSEHYTANERRVRLERGEAHFRVAKNPARPFFVEAGGVSVRAVGTEFNVRLDSASVEVLVTEGQVQLGAVSPSAGMAQADPGPYLVANERTVVSLAPTAPAPQVSAVAPAEIEARLAWKPRLLDFNNTPLADIIAEFNRHNPVHIVIADTSIGELRLSATFRSDNVEGFVRLMESDFGLKSTWRSDTELALARGK